ncbi:hypothetical protein Godav_002131 [Gossypium davidsonii]|uniref:RNase H type-1 domain-containing protein n=1 Tax=Gossypium davidsonii TaxID=34287 RepID=A0A7J8SVY9_GOSDV|nr:hypothetical protein [Gossypium davidsonii]
MESTQWSTRGRVRYLNMLCFFSPYAEAVWKVSTLGYSPTIARDSNGKILDEINALVRAKSVQVAEALALRLGSVLAKRWQWESIIFESDNKELIRSVKNKSFNCSGSLAIEQDIVFLLNSVSACLSFIPWTANKAVDWIAECTRKGICPLD